MKNCFAFLFSISAIFFNTDVFSYEVRYLCPDPNQIQFLFYQGSYETEGRVEMISPTDYPAFRLDGFAAEAIKPISFHDVEYIWIRKNGISKIICDYDMAGQTISLEAHSLPELDLCLLAGKLSSYCDVSRKDCELDCEVQ